MKTFNFILFASIAFLLNLPAFGQDVTVSTISGTIRLQNNSFASGAVGVVGFFRNDDNSAVSDADILANYTDFGWLTARFRPFSSGTGPAPISTFTVDSAGQINFDNIQEDPNNFFSFTGNPSPQVGSATSLTYIGREPYVWLFSGGFVPTSAASYLTMETGIFRSPTEFLPDGFANSTSFTFGIAPITEIVFSGVAGDADYNLVAVPEPSTVALALLGAAGIVIARRRRK